MPSKMSAHVGIVMLGNGNVEGEKEKTVKRGCLAAHMMI